MRGSTFSKRVLFLIIRLRMIDIIRLATATISANKICSPKPKVTVRLTIPTSKTGIMEVMIDKNFI